MGRGALDVDGDREPLTIGDGHDLRPLATLSLADASASLLGWRGAPIDECFLQIQIALVVQCLSEDFEDAPQHAESDPLLKPAVAGLIRRIAVLMGMSRSSEGHPFRLASVPIGRIAFRSRNGVYRNRPSTSFDDAFSSIVGPVLDRHALLESEPQ